MDRKARMMLFAALGVAALGVDNFPMSPRRASSYGSPGMGRDHDKRRKNKAVRRAIQRQRKLGR